MRSKRTIQVPEEKAPIRTKHRIEFVREEVLNFMPKWELMRAALAGEDEVKKLGVRVLPKPNADDTSKENTARYESYLGRAVFFPVTGRTAAGLTGYAFSSPPIIALPKELEVLKDNVDGGGVTLNQQAEEALRRLLTLGRCGLLVDFPSLSQPATKADIAKGRIRPTIQIYEPDQIVDWDIDYNGGEKIITLVVLKEQVEIRDNIVGGIKKITQWRELKLTDAGYSVRLYKQVEENGESKVQDDVEVLVKGNDGKPLDRIPFQFLGAKNNDETIDVAPLQDMMYLNFAHFRNSADYEEACFICGQPTPVFTGLTEAWVKEQMGGKVLLGSRKAVPLPKDATAELLQANPNTMPKEAMEQKEKQMLSLGARLVESGATVQRTATEATQEHTSDVSVLSTATGNVVSGYKQALIFATWFVPADEAVIRYELAEPLARKSMTPELANAISLSWQSGVISFAEARQAFRQAGIAFQTDKEAQASVQSDPILKAKNDREDKAAAAKEKSSAKKKSSEKKPEPQ